MWLSQTKAKRCALQALTRFMQRDSGPAELSTAFTGRPRSRYRISRWRHRCRLSSLKRQHPPHCSVFSCDQWGRTEPLILNAHAGCKLLLQEGKHLQSCSEGEDLCCCSTSSIQISSLGAQEVTEVSLVHILVWGRVVLILCWHKSVCALTSFGLTFLLKDKAFYCWRVVLFCCFRSETKSFLFMCQVFHNFYI